MIDYYQIIIIILIVLILYNVTVKENLTNTKIIETSEEKKVLDLSILENKNKKELEDLSRENQRVFLNPGSNKSKLQILTNFYTQKFII